MRKVPRLSVVWSIRLQITESGSFVIQAINHNTRINIPTKLDKAWTIITLFTRNRALMIAFDQYSQKLKRRAWLRLMPVDWWSDIIFYRACQPGKTFFKRNKTTHEVTMSSVCKSVNNLIFDAHRLKARFRLSGFYNLFTLLLPPASLFVLISCRGLKWNLNNKTCVLLDHL
jgi:hypothetical protein